MLIKSGENKDYLSDPKIDEKINAEMSFWLLLKLLLWKNWLVRKRNKWRTIIEFLWPLLMMLFVVLLHSIGEKHKNPNCHFKAKALPTAGEVLFLQTFFCAINNTCDNRTDAENPCFVSSLVSDLGIALQESFNLTTSGPSNQNQSKTGKEENQRWESFPLQLKNWIKDILVVESIIEAVKKHQREKRDSHSKTFFKNETFNYSCSSEEFLNFDQQLNFGSNFNQFLVNLNDKIKNENEKDLLVLSRVKKKIYLASMIDSFYRFLKGGNNESGKNHSHVLQLNIIDYIFCGPHVPKLMAQITSLLKSGSSKGLGSGMNTRESQYVVQEPEWENDTSIFCNKIMRKLESKYPTRVLFRIFKPLIRGKLIYTPAAPVINRIMSRINQTFSTFGALKDFIETAKKPPEEIGKLKFEDIVNKFKNEESFLREIVDSKIGKMIIDNFSDEADDKNKNVEDVKLRVQKLLSKLDETIANWKGKVKDVHNKNGLSTLIPYLECLDKNRIISVPDEKSGIKEALHWLDRERLWGFIVFNDVPSDSKVLPPSLTYKISCYSSFRFPLGMPTTVKMFTIFPSGVIAQKESVKKTGIERTADTNRITDRIYIPRVRRNVIQDLREITGGLAYLQNMIDAELIKEYTGRKHVPGIYLKQTPYPCQIYDSFRDVITRTFPMFMVISWIFVFCMISKRIVLEKEILFRGTLRVFGVTNTLHWLSWFIDAFVPMVLVTSILSLLLLGGLIPNSSIFVIWIFLTAFTLPTITLAFVVSTFFFTSSFAMAVSGMIYFLLYLPYPPIQNFGEALNPHFKIFTCLISNVGFGLGCTWIANMEEIGIGAQLDKMNFSPVPGNPITMSLIIEMFLLDSIIYLLLAIYLDNVLYATDYARQPWYYFLTPIYWKECCSKEKIVLETFQPPPPVNLERDGRYFEAEPEDVHVGIEVINLTKEFQRGDKKMKVVKNLTVNFYEDQITSFLGPNGAGKTTTVSMMIGLLPITEGTVRIYGVDIKNNPRSAIKDIGLCRQENVLLDDLTVEEHFKFFGSLKNRTRKEIDMEIKELIDDLQLGHRAKKPVKILSGGMKRKVCVAMAFIGGSRTVFLDEPTAGVDPYARRAIWELLFKYKKGRTIILTTHFLDEADILGDRIAIISSGELQCCGSSMFLKSNFGKGYYLTIESNVRSVKFRRKANELTKGSTQFEFEELNKLIKKIIPTSEFYEQIGSEIVFILPSDIDPDKYNQLFSQLEETKEKLNFNSYGVTNSSLEEVFIKMALEANKKEREVEDAKAIKNVVVSSAPFSPVDAGAQEEEKRDMAEKKNEPENEWKLSGNKILREHFVALMIKRYIHHRRNFKILLLEILLPTLFMAIALALGKTLPATTEMPPLAIDPSIYESASLFYTNEFPENSRLSSYEKVLLGPYDIGTKCIINPEKCSLKSISKGSLIASGRTEDMKECTCKDGYFKCKKDKSLKKPPNTETSAGFTLYNMTGLNVSNWLIATEFDDSAQRLGGISLGYFKSLSGISTEEFLNLFMFKRFIKIVENSVSDNIPIDPEILTLLLMTTSCNKTYGEELFHDMDAADNVIIWFNNRAWFASLALMNGVTNVVLRASLPNGSDPSKYSIKFIDHPLPISKRQLQDQLELQTNVALMCALSVIWALAFIPAMYGVYLVEERRSGLKNLEIVSGLNRTIYWLSNLVWDLASYSVSILPIVILYFLFDMTSFIGKDNIATFVVLLYSYGFVNITFVYAISFGFSIPSTAFIFIACWNILTGVITLLLTFTLTMIDNAEDPFYLNAIFMIFPQFCFGKSLMNMALTEITDKSLENFGVSISKEMFDWNSTLKYITVMLISGVLYFLITLLLEYRIFQWLIAFGLKKIGRRKRNQPNDDWKKNEEEDVTKERERVESGKAKEDGDVLIVNNLTKAYSKKEPPAVNHVSVAIKSGECFGLLGLNGAGKTTIFKMLTGYTSPTEGDATVSGFSIKENSFKKKFSIGYCPQVNALDPYLTAEEHLSFFCRIKGVTGPRRSAEVFLNLERLGLTQQKKKIVKKLSGGNKRKVNTAIALSCGPELVLLDEPTSGMDVLSKRLLWDCLQEVVLEGCCVVLTTHSMEECQALCTHLSIMVNGRFSCFGSCQHLKNKFNEGYRVTMRLPDVGELESVVKYVEKNLPGSTLLQVHHKQITYKLSPKIFIGKVFKVMSEAKEQKLIQHYSIAQSTLEDVFLKLAINSKDVELQETQPLQSVENT